MSEAITDPDVEKEVLDEEPRSILMGIIAQLGKGMDLHRVTLPTFVLEPRSMLERITDFMSHPDLLLNVPQMDDPVERFVQVVKYFLSGWHIRPKGVKKPYNPVLGEFFRCRWSLPPNTGRSDSVSDAFYISEQVSHHPPISAFYYCSPENETFISGELHPKAKFLGNSAATIMQGNSRIKFKNRPKEEYVVLMPNVYARGILFGTMMIELGDNATVRCDATGLVCELEFTTKGFFSGSYNGLKGKIKRISSGEVLYNISGKWTDVIYIQKNAKNANQEPFFEVATASIFNKAVLPEDKQEEYESRRLWSKLTKGLLARDMDLATQEKTAVEDHQRKLRQNRADDKTEHHSRFFSLVNDQWIFKHEKELFDLSADESKARASQVIFADAK